MQGTIKITLPEERFSSIDYFLEEVERLEEVIGKVTGIKLTVSSYNRMKQDLYIYQDTNENGEYEKWVGEETTIGDKYYPPLTYFLSKQNNGEALVKRIKYGEKVFEFQSESNYNVIIDY